MMMTLVISFIDSFIHSLYNTQRTCVHDFTKQWKMRMSCKFYARYAHRRTHGLVQQLHGIG